MEEHFEAQFGKFEGVKIEEAEAKIMESNARIQEKSEKYLDKRLQEFTIEITEEGLMFFFGAGRSIESQSSVESDLMSGNDSKEEEEEPCRDFEEWAKSNYEKHFGPGS